MGVCVCAVHVCVYVCVCVCARAYACVCEWVGVYRVCYIGMYANHTCTVVHMYCQVALSTILSISRHFCDVIAKTLRP